MDDDNSQPVPNGNSATNPGQNMNLTPAQRMAMAQALFMQQQAPAASTTTTVSPLSLITQALRGYQSGQMQKQLSQNPTPNTQQQPIQAQQQQDPQSGGGNGFDPSFAQGMSDDQILQMIQGGMSASAYGDPTQA
jgi:hypothetical protein